MANEKKTYFHQIFTITRDNENDFDKAVNHLMRNGWNMHSVWRYYDATKEKMIYSAMMMRKETREEN
jgi:uncharacterized membrane-anchored protein YitT (DUF2179 family)